MEKVNKGRKMVIAIIAIVLIIDLAIATITSSMYAVSGKMDFASYRLMQSICRFIIEGILSIFLYKGHRWAKWTWIVLFTIVGTFSLISLLVGFNVIILAMGLVYLFFGIILIISCNINLFFRFQRGVFIPESDDVIFKPSDLIDTQE